MCITKKKIVSILLCAALTFAVGCTTQQITPDSSSVSNSSSSSVSNSAISSSAVSSSAVSSSAVSSSAVSSSAVSSSAVSSSAVSSSAVSSGTVSSSTVSSGAVSSSSVSSSEVSNSSALTSSISSSSIAPRSAESSSSVASNSVLSTSRPTNIVVVSSSISSSSTLSSSSRQNVKIPTDSQSSSSGINSVKIPNGKSSSSSEVTSSSSTAPTSKMIANIPLTPTYPTNVPNTFDFTKMVSETFEKINGVRKDLGLNEFVYDINLQKVAQVRSTEMMKNDAFSHTRPTGGTFDTLIRPYGINNAVAENLAWASAHESIIDQINSGSYWCESWVGSPKHYEIMKKSMYTNIGIAFDYVYHQDTAEYEVYATCIFAQANK